MGCPKGQLSLQTRVSAHAGEGPGAVSKQMPGANEIPSCGRWRGPFNTPPPGATVLLTLTHGLCVCGLSREVVSARTAQQDGRNHGDTGMETPSAHMGAGWRDPHTARLHA